MDKWLLIGDVRNLNCDETQRTFDSGLEALRRERWATLCIDHDLGEKEERKNGYQIINVAIEEGILPPHVQIVASNPAGMRNIQRALLSVGYDSRDGRNYFRG
jgi:hypothetical protein